METQWISCDIKFSDFKNTYKKDRNKESMTDDEVKFTGLVVPHFVSANFVALPRCDNPFSHL